MRILVWVLVGLLGVMAPVSAQQRVVNVYNWSDYIDPHVLEQFEKETGIHVQYDVYDSLETLEGKLLAGHSGYDVVVPTNEPTFSRLIRSGALKELDRSKLPHWNGLDPGLMKQVAASDPGNKYGVIYMWGTIGLGMDPGKIHALAPDAPLDSWALLLDPANAKRVAGCGITMLDSAIDVIPSVLKYLGKSPDSVTPADLASVETTLRAIRPYIRDFSSGGTIEALASGDACLAFAYSGDVIQAQARAIEAGKGADVHYVAPKEGAQEWFDMLAIPADAPHPDAALAFIDFMMRPDVAAANTNQVRYPNAIPESRGLIKAEVADDPNIFPPAEERTRFFTTGPVPQGAERARSRMWARFKAGN